MSAFFNAANRRLTSRHLISLAALSCLFLLNACVFSPNIALLSGDRKPKETIVTEANGKADGKLLLLNIHGVISSIPTRSLIGLSSGPSLLEKVDSALKRAKKDKSLRGIILHINSPGGGVTASDEIYQLIQDFKAEAKVPVVAVFADIAASGGFYVGCAADYIIAQPTGVTGSIGVLLTKYDASGLLKKVGISDETLHAGRLKTMLSPTRQSTAEETQLAQQIINSMHQRFVDIVRKARPKLANSDISNVTDGRILTTEQAIAAGLVDRSGRLKDAIEYLRELSKSPNAEVVRYDNIASAGTSLYSNATSTSLPSNALSSASANSGAALALRAWQQQQGGTQFMYIWPGALFMQP